jgi:ATP-binding cassette subfamily F protein 3
MLNIQDLSYYIGDRVLYDKVSLHVGERDRIGLIGVNGAGKSTLLRLIAGEYTPAAGTITKPSDYTIGFLNQDMLSLESHKPIREVALEAFAEVWQIEARIKQLTQELAEDYTEDKVQELTQLQARFEAMEGYRLPAQAEAILEGLGFKTEDLQRPLSIFSGGWRMRVMLAKLLLQKPSLLMLDEPTNHLDLPSIQWLEQYLLQYPGAMIVVSHDRYFLNRLVNRIVEVRQGKLEIYEGNYDFYEKEKATRRALQMAAYENQQEKIKQTERFIERFRAKATKARQVQSKIKMLERMERIELPENEQETIRLKFPIARTPGKELICLKQISKRFGDLRLLENTDATVYRGDRIALIGANGKGKSTLLRILAGTEPCEGIREVGHQVDIAYYAQHQIEALNLNNDILGEMLRSCPQKTESYLRSLLGGFLFHGDDVFKKISVLSGGERARVALAKVLSSEANLLLLDEPTNHLDIPSVNVLIDALQEYEGSYVAVSHDRHFLQAIANKVWYIDNGKIKEFLGTYQEFEEWYAEEWLRALATAQANAVAQTQTPAVSSNQERRQRLKELQREWRRCQKTIEQLEARLMALEEEQKQIEMQMAQPAFYNDATQVVAVQQHYEQLKKTIDDLMAQWEAQIQELEALESQIQNLKGD